MLSQRLRKTTVSKNMGLCIVPSRMGKIIEREGREAEKRGKERKRTCRKERLAERNKEAKRTYDNPLSVSRPSYFLPSSFLRTGVAEHIRERGDRHRIKGLYCMDIREQEWTGI